jgi:transposase
MRVGTVFEPRFIKDALNLVDRSGRSMAEIAKDLGIPRSTIYYWSRKRKLNMPRKKTGRQKREPAVMEPETPQETIDRLERELKAARKENEELKMDREILKKAAAFFAKENE